MGRLFQELKRRNVFRVGVAYVIVAWLLLQVADVVLPTFRTPDWVMQAFTFLLVLGFPLALIFAWAFELTPEGLKLEKQVVRDESITQATGRKLDLVIIAMLVVALGYFGYDKFILNPDRHAAEIEAAVQVAREELISAVEPQDSAKTIVVLPFVNMSNDPDNEYFSDGISEEILNLLAKVPELRVTSRSSAFSFKGQNVDVPTMAARLHVAHVLEGSVRKSGNQLRITAQLIEVEADTHLWSETYDRELENVFAIQDEIATAVVDALKITLLGKELKTTETDPEAFALYLQGRRFANQVTAESNKQAEALLKQALAIDPRFAPAWTELGSVYQAQADLVGGRPIDEGHELARDAIQRALAIDPQNGRAYMILAWTEQGHDRDFRAANKHMWQSLALNPGDAYILRTAAWLVHEIGHVDEAIDLNRRSIALDPLSPQGHINLGATYLKAHRLEEAADSLQLGLSLMPGHSRGQLTFGMVLLAQGDAPAALVAIKQVTSVPWRVFGMAIVQHALGDTAASDAALNTLIECCAAAGAYQVAQVYAFRGEIDPAFEWLGQAYDNRDGGLTGMLNSRSLTNLHDDPRWEPFLDKVGLPH